MGEDFCLEELQIWKTARRLVREIYRYCPEIENDNFNVYLRRSSVAVLCNITEGYLCSTAGEFRMYLRQAYEDCEEIRGRLSLPEAETYLEESVIDSLHLLCRGMVSEIGRALRNLQQRRKRLTFNDEA